MSDSEVVLAYHNQLISFGTSDVLATLLHWQTQLIACFPPLVQVLSHCPSLIFFFRDSFAVFFPMARRITSREDAVAVISLQQVWLVSEENISAQTGVSVLVC